MKFPYWEVQRGAESRFLPLLPITLHGPRDALSLLALADSGAEHSVFGLEVAERLELSLADSLPVRIVGVGEQESLGHLIIVDLQLERNRWVAPAIFSPSVGQRAILGQLGFFAFFAVRNRAAFDCRI
jgi:Aspartyl protease